MSSKKKKGRRSKKLNEAQKCFLISYLESHRDLVSRKFSPNFTEKIEDRLWTAATFSLNQLGVPKSKDDWKKAFVGFKTKTKAKAREIFTSQRKTGGGKGTVNYDSLSSFEARMFTLLGGPSIIEGEKAEEFGVNRALFQTPAKHTFEGSVVVHATEAEFLREEYDVDDPSQLPDPVMQSQPVPPNNTETPSTVTTTPSPPLNMSTSEPVPIDAPGISLFEPSPQITTITNTEYSPLRIVPRTAPTPPSEPSSQPVCRDTPIILLLKRFPQITALTNTLLTSLSEPIIRHSEPMISVVPTSEHSPQNVVPANTPVASSEPLPQSTAPVTAPITSTESSPQPTAPIPVPIASTEPLPQSTAPVTAPITSTEPLPLPTAPVTVPIASTEPSPQPTVSITTPIPPISEPSPIPSAPQYRKRKIAPSKLSIEALHVQEQMLKYQKRQVEASERKAAAIEKQAKAMEKQADAVASLANSAGQLIEIYKDYTSPLHSYASM